jgi:O-antigen/teichoic acid export membrane protein
MGRRIRILKPLTTGGKGFLAIFAGTATGQLLAILASPLITRLFSPSDFGILSIVSALALTVTPLASLRFELAIPLARDGVPVRALIGLAMSAVLISLVLGTLLLVVASVFCDDLSMEPQLRNWLWVVPALASSMALFQILNVLAIRQARYTAIARRNILQASTMIAVQLLAGLLGYRVGGLLGGLLVGQVVGTVSLLSGAHLLERRRRPRLTAGELGSSLRRYKKFPLLLAPAGFLNSLGVQAPLLLIAYWYGGAAAGWFGLTQRVLAVPAMLVGQAVAQVFLSEIAEARRTGSNRELAIFAAASKRLGLVGFAGSVLVIAIAPSAFESVFGPQWRESGLMAQALAITLAAQLLASPVSQTLIVYERTAVQLAWDTARLVVVVATILISAANGHSLMFTVWAYGIASTIAYLISWELSRRSIVRDA